MKIRTCTKVNIGLNILRRRPDGYHDIETLFVPYYGLGDELTVEPSERTSISLSGDYPIDWDPQDDITLKAWKLLREDFPGLPEVSISLRKHAPAGAGLGGGSADAAFILRALNELGGLGLDAPALASYAARLGSDCPFFVWCRPMFGSGRGEVLEPFDPALDGYEIRVEVPAGVAVSTREAYAGIVPGEPQMPLREALKLPVSEWKHHIFNDFEAGVGRAHPEIPALVRRMYGDGAIYAAMSGSGSAVFGIFRK